MVLLDSLSHKTKLLPTSAGFEEGPLTTDYHLTHTTFTSKHDTLNTRISCWLVWSEGGKLLGVVP
jgi:hypothetical protein